VLIERNLSHRLGEFGVNIVPNLHFHYPAGISVRAFFFSSFLLFF